MPQDYEPKSLHEFFTWVLGLPIEASATEIADTLEEKTASMEEEAGEEHPDSHMILVMAINADSDSEKDALLKLMEVARKVAGMD